MKVKVSYLGLNTNDTFGVVGAFVDVLLPKVNEVRKAAGLARIKVLTFKECAGYLKVIGMFEGPTEDVWIPPTAIIRVERVKVN